MKEVQNKIRVLRAARRITQGYVADRLEVTRQQVANIENHVTESISYAHIAELMDIFGLESFDDLFELVEVERQADEGQLEPLLESA